MSNYMKDEILAELDISAPYTFFLDLEHGYFYTAGSRISLFADNERWAIVFEKSGYSNRGLRAEIELNYFGNCLQNLSFHGSEKQFICNMESITVIDGDELIRIDGDFELVAKDVKTVLARGKQIQVEHSVEKYQNLGIEIQDFDNPDQLIDFPSLIRYLDVTHTDLFRATESELRNCLPDDIPFLMKIDEWHHRYYFDDLGDKPSSYETFPMIADILIEKDPSLWKPTLPANNHWRNWPEAGGL